MQNRIDKQMIWVVSRLLSGLGVHIPRALIARELLYHPDFPSMLAMIETMRFCGISCEAFQASIEQIQAISLPAIIKMKSGDFALLIECGESQMLFRHPEFGLQTVTREKFETEWSNLVIVARRPSLLLRDSQRFLMFNNIRIPLAILLGIFILVAVIVRASSYTSLPWIWSLLLFLKGMGLVCCFLLVTADLTGGSLLQKFCPQKKEFSCIEVLSSPGGKLLGIPLTDLGIVYFGGGLLALCTAPFFAQQSLIWAWVAGITVAAMPYSIFSVIYQWRIVRKWCMICLAIQAIIWLELLLLYCFVGYQVLTLIYSITPPLPLIGCFVFVILTWLITRELMQRQRLVNELQLRWYRIRRDPRYIEFRMESSRIINISPLGEELVIGNPISTKNLTIVVAPGCRHCRAALEDMRRLLSVGLNNYKLHVRFLLPILPTGTQWNDLSDAHQVVYTILGLLKEGKEPEAVTALVEWFSKHEESSKEFLKVWLEKFASKPIDKYTFASATLMKYCEWAQDAKILGVPSLIVGNRLLPEDISIRDASYFLLRKDYEKAT